ncbi:MAG: hypothetical protein ACLQT5_17610 [Steroidobacteraceae bacterium]
MSSDNGARLRAVLPLPAFVLHPYTALLIATVHVYLSFGHLSRLFGGEVEWTHIWKDFGALAGVYVFAALASRGLARHAGALQKEPLTRSHV